MSTLANITSLNLSLVTGGAALAIKAASRLTPPARTVYVYGTADDVAPNFTTVAGALTYAQSIGADPTEPVVVRLFAQANNIPYDLNGLPEAWDYYTREGIYFVSDFVRINETTTLPASLAPGLTVWYIDPNGVETLWVGREDGSAWPAVGYKEYVALVTFDPDNNPVSATEIVNQFGVTPSFVDEDSNAFRVNANFISVAKSSVNYTSGESIYSQSFMTTIKFEGTALFTPLLSPSAPYGEINATICIKTYP